MKRVLGPQVSAHNAQGLFGGPKESLLIKNLLNTPKSLKEFPFVDVYRQLGAQSIARQPVSNTPIAKVSKQALVPSKAALALMMQPAVTSKGLDSFLESQYLAAAAPAEKLEALDRGLFDLIAASTPNNLRTMMQYLARFWQCGLFGSRPLIRSARNHARTVLQRAIEVHPATAHANGGEQVGVPDLHKFETFVRNFFDYLGVQHSSEDELEELLLQLAARSGTLAAAMTQVMSIPEGSLSEESVDCFLFAFAASKPSRKSVEALKHVLLNSQTGPSAVRFLLQYIESTPELFDLLDVVDRSTLRKDVYESLQEQILQRLLELGNTEHNLGLSFAFLARVQAAEVWLRAEAVDLTLRTALQSTNDSAVYRALQLGSDLAAPLNSDLVSEADQRINPLQKH